MDDDGSAALKLAKARSEQCSRQAYICRLTAQEGRHE